VSHCPALQLRIGSLRPLHSHLPARAGWHSLGRAPSGSAAGPAQHSTPICIDARPNLPRASTWQSSINSLQAVWLTFKTPRGPSGGVTSGTGSPSRPACSGATSLLAILSQT